MIKKFLVGTFAIAAFALVVSTVSAYDFGTTTLRVGSKGEAVKTLQTLVGATPVDGSFGPMTKVKVMAWQASNGLTADGVFGPMSMAKANAGTTVGTFPAGCTSTMGFSSTTGAKCDGSTTTGGTVAGPLVGGAGDIVVTETTTDVVDDIIEGDNDQKVLGFKVEAQDSDVKVSNIKLTFFNDGTGSYRLNRYVDSVSVWMGGTKVATIDSADFTKDGYDYTKSIALTDAIVREGSSKKATFYVTVDAVSNIDSADLGALWDITADNFRFQDATGVIMTSTEFADTLSMSVNTMALSGDVKLVVSKASSNPLAQTVKVSDTSSTSDVLMLAFNLKDTGSDMTFDALNVNVDGTLSAATLADMLGELTLMQGSTELASISDFSGGDGIYTFDLDDTYTLDADTTTTFKVVAKINDVDNFDENDSLTVSFDSIAAEDSNGDVVSDTGSAAGTDQTFVLNAPSLSLVSKSFALSQSIDGVAAGQEDVFLAKFVVNVTAGDEDVYLPTAIDTAVLNADFATYSELNASPIDSVVVDAEDETIDDSTTSSYLITAGSTEKFTISFYVRGNDSAEKITLTGFHYALADDTTVPYTAYTSVVDSGLSSFATSTVYLAK